MGACRAIRCGDPVSTISQGSVSDQNSTRASCHGVSMEDAVVDRGCGNDSTRVTWVLTPPGTFPAQFML